MYVGGGGGGERNIITHRDQNGLHIPFHLKGIKQLI